MANSQGPAARKGGKQGVVASPDPVSPGAKTVPKKKASPQAPASSANSSPSPQSSSLSKWFLVLGAVLGIAAALALPFWTGSGVLEQAPVQETVLAQTQAVPQPQAVAETPKPAELKVAVRPVRTENGECVDRNPSCASWARVGECDKNPGYMLRHCMVSCDQCATLLSEVPLTYEPAEQCPAAADVRVLSGLVAAPEAIRELTPSTERVWVARNGANEGVYVSWSRMAQSSPGCLHALIMAVAEPLQVNRDVTAASRQVQVTTHRGWLVPNETALAAGSRVHLILPGQIWQWPGIEVGHVEHDVSVLKPGVKMTTLSMHPRIFLLEGMLEESDCDEMIAAGEDALARSQVGYEGMSSDTRTSSTSSPTHHPSSLRYRARGFDIARMAPREALVDGMQLVRYQPGQLFRAHHDYFGKALPQREPPGPDAPYPWPEVVDRYVTFFGYLNTLEGDSGHTVFTKAQNPPEGYVASQTSNLMAECREGLSVRPIKGNVVLFYNMTPDQQLEPDSLHGGCPPNDQAVKYGANLWLWNSDRPHSRA